MYRCKECGAEYDIKPDYCDCGNDEFELAGVEPVSQIDFASADRVVDIEYNAPEETVKPEPQPAPKPQPAPQSASQTSFHSTQTAVLHRPSVDPASLSIFCLCLLLSMYVIFFAWNPKETDSGEITSKPQETVTAKNIPSVDKIWNNALPKVQPKKEETPKQEENIIKQIIPAPIAQKIQTNKTEPKTTQKSVQNTTAQQKKTTTVPLKKATQTTAKKTTTAAKTQTTTAKTTQEQQKKAAEQQAKQKAEQERKAAEEAQIKKLQAEQAKKNAEAKAKQDAVAKQELVNYKGSLRNAIGRKIDFTRVIGDGACTVAFKIDSNGKLTNRYFAKQSTNNTLNDEVYAAVMATPTFNPPPSAYKGEVLNLNIRFSNGNFEISLP